MTLALLALMLAAEPSDRPAVPVAPKVALICRESEQQIGSHIRTGRRCKTAEEWRQEDEGRGQAPASARITEGQPDMPTTKRPP